MSYLALARKFCTQLGIDTASGVRSTSRPPGAIPIRSRLYGDVWLVLETAVLENLGAEEARCGERRPVLRAEDVARLRGKPESVIRAALEAARVWPGPRVVS